MKIKIKNRSILLVDDDPICNIICKKLIKELGFNSHIAVATNGKEALDYLESASKESNPIPSLILLDINMPEMDGWEFLENFEKLPKKPFQNIKIVMLTSSISPFDVKKAENNALLDGYNRKPVDVETMSSILDKYF